MFAIACWRHPFVRWDFDEIPRRRRYAVNPRTIVIDVEVAVTIAQMGVGGNRLQPVDRSPQEAINRQFRVQRHLHPPGVDRGCGVRWHGL